MPVLGAEQGFRLPEVPVGTVVDFLGLVAPEKWLICDGSPIDRTQYSALFALIGTTFGVGDGSTTFNLPDTRGRTVHGVGTGSGLTARSLGDTGGAETHAVTTSEMPSHNHTTVNTDVVRNNGTNGNAGLSVSTGGILTQLTTNNTGSGTAMSLMEPFICFVQIVKVIE